MKFSFSDPLRLAWAWSVKKISGNPRKIVTEEDILNVDTPNSVGCEIINICNARCSFCGYGKGKDGKAADPRKKGKLDRDVFRHTLKLFSQAGGGNFSLTPILGEASADPKWLELVKEAVSYPNIDSVSCFTNAILLDRFGYNEILTSGLHTINISTALGSREQYKRLYGKDKYETVLNNIIGMLKENNRLGNPVLIRLFLRIDKPFSNFTDSDVYRQLCDLIDADNFLTLDDAWDDFRGLISQDEIPKGHQFSPPITDKSKPCYALYRKLEVLTDGKIQACSCRVEPELWCGNIMDYDTIEEAWRNPELENLRASWHDGKIPDCCQACSHYEPYTNLIREVSPRSIVAKFAKRISPF